MSSKNPVQRLLDTLDSLQQRYPVLSFPFAVVKKYGEDEAGHRAALITYYGFLSLFPLLIVATSLVDIFSDHSAGVQHQLTTTINNYFPIVGNGLQSSIHSPHKSGLALLLGTLFTLYGARGIADAIRGALDHVWAIPRIKRSGFPANALKSFGLLLGAGFGVLLTTSLAGIATSAFGNAWYLRLVPIIVNLGLLYLIFMFVFSIGPSRRPRRAAIRPGALLAAGGLLVLQTAGGYLITHQLHNLNGLYGQFALVLAILFWIYLQAQVLVYAMEVNAVRAYKLWPRSLIQPPLTSADKEAFRRYAEKETYRPASEETVSVVFHEAPSRKRKR